MAELLKHLARWADTLMIFDYESTGDETLFRDRRDPQPRLALTAQPHHQSIQSGL